MAIYWGAMRVTPSRGWRFRLRSWWWWWVTLSRAERREVRMLRSLGGKKP